MLRLYYGLDMWTNGSMSRYSMMDVDLYSKYIERCLGDKTFYIDGVHGRVEDVVVLDGLVKFVIYTSDYVKNVNRFKEMFLEKYKNLRYKVTLPSVVDTHVEYSYRLNIEY